MKPIDSSTSARLIAIAVSLVGDSAKVREHMKCSESAFLEYREGTKQPSGIEMEGLVGLIIHEQGLVIAKNRELIAKLRSKRAESGDAQPEA